MIGGEAGLTYKAGGQDRTVKFSVKYQPEGFPGVVQAEATVQVIPSDYDLMLRLETHVVQKGNCTETGKNPPYTMKGSTERELHAIFIATYKLTHASPKEKEIFQMYETTATPLLSFFFAGKARREMIDPKSTSIITWIE